MLIRLISSSVFANPWIKTGVSGINKINKNYIYTLSIRFVFQLVYAQVKLLLLA